jgi:hypothetical protein
LTGAAKTRLHAYNFYRRPTLLVAVMLGMMAAGFGMMMFGVAGVAVRAVRMVRRLFMITGFMMFGGFVMVLRGMLVVFGGFAMVLNACVVAHIRSPGLMI